MVISHEHKYVFVECPLTASWAIRQQLCKHYWGTPVLHKHASYPEFWKTATKSERDYFAFAAVRNPLEVLVSRYLKLKSNHKNAFSNDESLVRLEIDYSDRKQFQYVNSPEATFSDYFKRFCTRYYSDLIDLSSNSLHFVIRFERLQEDFSEVLRRVGLTQVQPVPVLNKTSGKNASWQSYYTPDIIELAKSRCGPAMRKWGYSFPESWGPYRPHWADYLEHRCVTSLRNYYLLHLRYNHAGYARTMRRLRAALLSSRAKP